jgi:hypothetical protein
MLAPVGLIWQSIATSGLKPYEIIIIIFFVFDVITTDEDPDHISIGCKSFHLKRLGISCAILVFYEGK